MKKDEVIDILTEYSTNDRLSKFLMQNEKYKTALKNEEKQYNNFDKTLTDEQKALLDSFSSASAATTAFTKKIVYQQGFKICLICLCHCKAKAR